MKRFQMSTIVCVLVASGVAAFQIASAQTADPTANWIQRDPATSPPARVGHAMVYDAGHKTVLLFGGGASGDLDDTWEWDGGTWNELDSLERPPGRYAHAMAHDAERGRTVMFGGRTDASLLGDTWEWDGANWIERSPATAPPAQSGAVMVYDVARSTIVLFGGGDTWEWSGSDWTLRTPAAAPSPSGGAVMAYDIERERTVLFGAPSADGTLNGTWEWDGNNWVERSPATSPSARRIFSGMVYDAARGHIVLFGGRATDLEYLNDTWEWDGEDWIEIATAIRPSGRDYHSLAYDASRGRTVLFGGRMSTSPTDLRPVRLGDTWEYGTVVEPSPVPTAVPVATATITPKASTLAEWTEHGLSTNPSARSVQAMVYDTVREQLMSFGGYLRTGSDSDETWDWDGRRWRQITPSKSPPARSRHVMAYDAARERVILFGGQSAVSGEVVRLADTWEWDGETWTQLSPPQSPPARSNAAIAYDAGRHRIVLFGGIGADDSILGDTWEWDGATWVPLAPTDSPSARIVSAMVYDVARERSILFGGRISTGSIVPGNYLADTWAWDGRTWTELSPAAAPSRRSGHKIAYDLERNRAVLFGGWYYNGSNSVTFAETWEWDGENWIEVAPVTSPPPRNVHSMAYDAARNRIVMFGGGNQTGLLGDTWEFAVPEPPASNALYLPLVFRAGAVEDPPDMIDQCARQAAGPPRHGAASAIDLSAAHSDIRFFGVAERYSTVDQALVTAFKSSGGEWPEDSVDQLLFLESYTAELEGVCALPAAEADLGPAGVELVDDGMALIHPGTGSVALPDEAKAIAIDLRGLPNVPELSMALAAAVAPALDQPVPRPARRVRSHYGLFGEIIYSGSSSRAVFKDVPPIAAEAATARPIVLLTDSRLAPAAAELAGTLRLANRAVVVGDDVLSAVAESRWSGIGASGLSWRSMDLRQMAPPTTTRFSDLELHQDDCMSIPWGPSSIKKDFTTSTSSAQMTVALTLTSGVALETDLDLALLFDDDKDGEFEWDEVWIEPGDGEGSGVGGPSNEFSVIDWVLPAGDFQVAVYGCTVPDGPVTAEVSVVVRPGYHWPDAVPADVPTDNPMDHLDEAVSLWSTLHDVVPPITSWEKSWTRPEVQSIHSYRDIQPVGTGPAEQRAALITLHGVYRKFFPYFDVVGDGIDDRLLETLSVEPPDGRYTRKSINYTLRRMTEVIEDGHSFVYDYGEGWDIIRLRAQLELVDGEPVVRRAVQDGINPGDTIVSFNGRPSAEVYAEEYARTSAATDGHRFEAASTSILAFDGPTALELRDPDGATHTVTVTDTGSATLGPRYQRNAGWLADLGAPGLYYINLDASAITDNATYLAVLTDAMGAEGLVVDLRGYPRGPSYSDVVGRFITTTVLAPVVRLQMYDGPDDSARREIPVGSPSPRLDPHYHGPIVWLTGPHAASAAEFFPLPLVGANRVTVVGQQSAGTTGELTGVMLPGGFGVTFTSQEVLYPDRSTFHGVGIVPDIEASPSAVDLRDGVDRELVTAVEFLLGR